MLMRPDTPLFDEDTSVQDIWDFVDYCRKLFLKHSANCDFDLVVDDYQYGLSIESFSYFRLILPNQTLTDSMSLDRIVSCIYKKLQKPPAH